MFPSAAQFIPQLDVMSEKNEFAKSKELPIKEIEKIRSKVQTRSNDGFQKFKKEMIARKKESEVLSKSLDKQFMALELLQESLGQDQVQSLMEEGMQSLNP